VDDTKPPPEPALVSIAATRPPDKTAYTTGEAFDPAGLVVTGTYDDGGTGAVTGYALSEPDMTAAGAKTVAITLGGLKAEFTITVSRKAASIAVTTPPAKTAYYRGEAFDPAGLVVTATYEDGETGELTGYALSEPDMTTEGEKTVAVTLGALSAEFTITVQKALVSIAVTTPPDKTAYYRGEAFDPAGLVVTATYEDGETGELTGYSLSEPDMETEGEKTIAVTLGALSAEFTIAVRKALVSIAVTTPPAKTLYYPGEAFDPAGLVVAGTYDDGTTGALTGYTLSEPDMGTEGKKTVAVTLGALGAEFAVTVRTLISFVVTTQPAKALYRIGEEFDPAGMVVTGTYDDNSARVETGYTLNNAGPFTESGERTVTVALGGFTAEIPITVAPAALTSIAVTTPPTKTAYYRGEAFDPAGLVVAGTYDDGTTGALTGYALSKPDLTTGGEKTVAVTLGALSAEFAITVRTLVSIAITTPPAKTAYYRGEAFDPAGLVVAGTYDDNGIRVEAGYTLSEPDMGTEGKKTVAVTLDALTAEFAITVRGLASIAVTAYPTKTLYQIGETFDPAGMVVTGTYTDGATRAETGYTLAGAGPFTESGERKVAVALGGFTAEVPITVAPAALVSIAVTKPPAKTLYRTGEAFDPAGMVVTGTYTDGETRPVTGFAASANTSAAGEITVTLTLEGKSAETRIHVTGGNLASLTIKTPPNKDVYFPGDSLNLDGLELEGVYADLPGNLAFPISVTAQNVTGYNNQIRGLQTLTVSIGGASAEFTITLRDEPYIYFDYGRRRTNLDTGGAGYTVPLYRDLVLAPVKWYISDNAVYSWELDGVAQAGTGECLTVNFNRANQRGTHRVKVTVTDGSVSVSAETLVECREQEGTFRRDKDDNSKARSVKVFDFTQAPGQFVTIMPTDTQETVLTAAQTKNDADPDSLDWKWSLGAWGGYIIFGFDHSIVNLANENDIAINGNGFGGWSEPGVVWVSQDDNGNGLPDDTWYELKGSEYGKPETVQRYAVSYYRPGGDKGPVWIDNQGTTGTFPGLTYYGERQGYPYHAGGDYVTFTGTKLPTTVDFGELITNPGFDWGYVDNDRPPHGFKIENAIQADGSSINLKYVDFVKVHTGQNSMAGILGEVSTETSAAYDYSLFHD
jgi:hypothetical protein